MEGALPVGMGRAGLMRAGSGAGAWAEIAGTCRRIVAKVRSVAFIESLLESLIGNHSTETKLFSGDPSRRRGHEIQRAGNIRLELASVNYGVEEAMFEQEFAALEAFGEFLADRLLDDPGAGEADQRARFGDVEVSEHGEAGGDASGGGVGEETDVGDAGFVELGEAGGDFSQLHEAYYAFHHAC